MTGVQISLPSPLQGVTQFGRDSVLGTESYWFKSNRPEKLCGVEQPGSSSGLGPVKLLVGGGIMRVFDMKAKDWQRFWDKVDIKSREECWEWMAAQNEAGYGRFRLNGELAGPHRLIWAEVHHERIPKDRDVCHSCDNPPCINPKHLFVGSRSENMLDAVRKGRLYTGGLDKGRKKSIENTRKLDKRQTFQVLQRYYNGESLQSISRDFPISPTSISHIKNHDRKSYLEWVEEWENRHEDLLKARV